MIEDIENNSEFEELSDDKVNRLKRFIEDNDGSPSPSLGDAMIQVRQYYKLRDKLNKIGCSYLSPRLTLQNQK